MDWLSHFFSSEAPMWPQVVIVVVIGLLAGAGLSAWLRRPTLGKW
jgi:hypothetical protein